MLIYKDFSTSKLGTRPKQVLGLAAKTPHYAERHTSSKVRRISFKATAGSILIINSMGILLGIGYYLTRAILRVRIAIHAKSQRHP